jgi:phage shock protein A
MIQLNQELQENERELEYQMRAISQENENLKDFTLKAKQKLKNKTSAQQKEFAQIDELLKKSFGHQKTNLNKKTFSPQSRQTTNRLGKFMNSMNT